MSIAAVAAIQARMDAIDARFASMGTVPGAIRPGGTVSATGDFDASLQSALGLESIMLRNDDSVTSVPYSSAVVEDGSTVAVSAAPVPGLGGSVTAGTPFAQEFEAAGARHGVPPKLLAAVGWVESRYQVDAVSEAGAIGLMQIMPMTAQELGVDPTDPVAAIDGAARLLADHHERFGSWDLALAAYHSGAGAVSRAGNTPPPRAAEYVRRIHERLDTA